MAGQPAGYGFTAELALCGVGGSLLPLDLCFILPHQRRSLERKADRPAEAPPVLPSEGI